MTDLPSIRDAINTSCSKCGDTDWTTTWFERRFYSDPLGKVSYEHMHHKCLTCGFEKISMPMDFKND